MKRALALDPGWNEGSLHEFFVSFDAAQDKTGGRPRPTSSAPKRSTATTGSA